MMMAILLLSFLVFKIVVWPWRDPQLNYLDIFMNSLIFLHILAGVLDPEKCTIGGQNEDSGKFHVRIRAPRHR